MQSTILNSKIRAQKGKKERIDVRFKYELMYWLCRRTNCSRTAFVPGAAATLPVVCRDATIAPSDWVGTIKLPTEEKRTQLWWSPTIRATSESPLKRPNQYWALP